MFIFAFFHKDEKMDAVMFELGYICCLYENDTLKDRLKFLFDTEDYDVVEETTAYIDTLLPNINHYNFNDLKDHKRAVIIIHRMIANR